jgi:hypothetical protein
MIMVSMFLVGFFSTYVSTAFELTCTDTDNDTLDSFPAN